MGAEGVSRKPMRSQLTCDDFGNSPCLVLFMFKCLIVARMAALVVAKMFIVVNTILTGDGTHTAFSFVA